MVKPIALAVGRFLELQSRRLQRRQDNPNQCAGNACADVLRARSTAARTPAPMAVVKGLIVEKFRVIDWAWVTRSPPALGIPKKLGS
jgi:hypothetical protein